MNRPILAAVVVVGAELAFAGSFLIGGPLMHSATAQATSPYGLTAEPYCVEGASVSHDGVWSCLGLCAEEDGNADGLPCLWTDKTTGAVFYVDSSNYRPVAP